MDGVSGIIFAITSFEEYLDDCNLFGRPEE
jgi:hypothetical protein